MDVWGHFPAHGLPESRPTEWGGPSIGTMARRALSGSRKCTLPRLPPGCRLRARLRPHINDTLCLKARLHSLLALPGPLCPPPGPLTSDAPSQRYTLDYLCSGCPLTYLHAHSSAPAGATRLRASLQAQKVPHVPSHSIPSCKAERWPRVGYVTLPPSRTPARAGPPLTVRRTVLLPRASAHASMHVYVQCPPPRACTHPLTRVIHGAGALRVGPPRVLLRAPLSACKEAGMRMSLRDLPCCGGASCELCRAAVGVLTLRPGCARGSRADGIDS